MHLEYNGLLMGFTFTYGPNSKQRSDPKLLDLKIPDYRATGCVTVDLRKFWDFPGKMDSDMEISLDRLPMKRLESIEENGAEHFPCDVGYDDKRVSLIRRIDFAWALEEEDDLKQKKSAKESSEQWPWKGMVENLQLAHQELSVIIDLINTVSDSVLGDLHDMMNWCLRSLI